MYYYYIIIITIAKTAPFSAVLLIAVFCMHQLTAISETLLYKITKVNRSAIQKHQIYKMYNIQVYYKSESNHLNTNIYTHNIIMRGVLSG